MKNLSGFTKLSNLSPEYLKKFIENLEGQNIEVRFDIKDGDLSIGTHFSTYANPENVQSTIMKLVDGTDFEIERWWDEPNTEAEGFSVIWKKSLNELTINETHKLFNLASELYKRVESL